MNTSRFYSVIDQLISDFNINSIINRLNQTIKVLSNLASQPNQNHEQAFKNTLSQLYTGLNSFQMNNPSASQYIILEEIMAFDKIGIGLLNRIDKIIKQNTITIAIASQQLTKIKDEVTQFYTSLVQLSDNFKKLALEKSDLDPGEVEINIVYPEDIHEFTLDNLKQEFSEIGLILKTIAEIYGEQVNSFDISSVSSSKFTVNIKSPIPIAIGLASIITFVLNSYNTILDIQLKRAELQKYGISQEILKQLEEEEHRIQEKAIEEIASKIVNDNCKSKDTGRANELKNALRTATKKLSEKLERGVDIDVVATKLPEPEVSEPTDNLNEDQIKAIQEMKARLQSAIEYNKQVDTVLASSKRIKTLRSQNGSMLAIEGAAI